MKKQGTPSPLDRLPLHVKQQLAGWLTTGGKHGQGITYAEARARLKAEHGVSASIDALCRHFQRLHRRPATSFSAPVLTIQIQLNQNQPRFVYVDTAAICRASGPSWSPTVGQSPRA